MRAYWGLNLFRNSEFGMPITEEIHKSTLDKKLEWYQNLLKEKAEKEAKEKKD